MFADDGPLPDCRTPAGCPIGEDIASDSQVNEYYDAFRMARALFDLNGIQSLLEKSYREMELLDYPEELLRLEFIYLKTKQKNARRSNTTH